MHSGSNKRTLIFLLVSAGWVNGPRVVLLYGSPLGPAWMETLSFRPLASMVALKWSPAQPAGREMGWAGAPGRGQSHGLASLGGWEAFGHGPRRGESVNAGEYPAASDILYSPVTR